MNESKQFSWIRWSGTHGRHEENQMYFPSSSEIVHLYLYEIENLVKYIKGRYTYKQEHEE